MLCRCIVMGTARLVGRDRPRLVEPGEIHDVELNEDGTVPANFVKVDTAAPPKKEKTRGRVKEEEDL